MIEKSDILKESLELGHEGADVKPDALEPLSLSKEELANIKEIAGEHTPQIHETHSISFGCSCGGSCYLVCRNSCASACLSSYSH
ncbi:hypothetical protein GJ688_07545 [Heliobacillus mobilis]|uniref:Uncharacterized protein n=2 Tax=Heliobacterium TaxID=2697 RepID=A0A6I3SIW8_HELMO|nr:MULTISPECIES: hypothetical protein [Heliobacterium]MBC9784693.1 hypothetical protein [Heliobacterium chlorum]MTV48834.1 hypothetical protein [Heliobacterium mobile]